MSVKDWKVDWYDQPSCCSLQQKLLLIEKNYDGILAVAKRARQFAFPKFIKRLMPNSSLTGLWGGIWKQNKRWRPKFGPTIKLQTTSAPVFLWTSDRRIWSCYAKLNHHYSFLQKLIRYTYTVYQKTEKFAFAWPNVGLGSPLLIGGDSIQLCDINWLR